MCLTTFLCSGVRATSVSAGAGAKAQGGDCAGSKGVHMLLHGIREVFQGIGVHRPCYRPC